MISTFEPAILGIRNTFGRRSLIRPDAQSEAQLMLRHSSDAEPGFTRKRMGRYWAYFDETGERVTDRETIDRLNALGLPPAYTDAWFCKHPNGHLQATGIDARGRKQYRYHADFRAKADKSKFEALIDFGKALPKIRRKVAKDLARRKLTRDAVIAAVVRLLDTEYLRIGNEQYARDNKSFGATTLLCRHVRSRGHRLTMRFAGKHGIVREVTITDRRLGRVVRRCQELPGQALFQYVNGSGEPQAISSSDVNDYIREASGSDFTAKHFRTWGASIIAFDKLLDAEEAERVSVQTVVEPVAEALGNTVAISRKAYVHPAIIETVKGRPRNALKGLKRQRARKWLSSTETTFLKFLSSRRRRRKPASA